MFNNLVNKAKQKNKERQSEMREIKAIEKRAYEAERKKVKAAEKRKKVAAAEAKGKAKARGKSSIGARLDRAAQRMEEMNKTKQKGKNKGQKPVNLLKFGE